jgi:hypothetical protein
VRFQHSMQFCGQSCRLVFYLCCHWLACIAHKSFRICESKRKLTAELRQLAVDMICGAIHFLLHDLD